MKRTTLTILLLLNLLITFAQSKPVTVLVTLTPPYSPFLNEYAATTTSRLQVTLIVNDSRMINYPVKLQMFVEKPGSGVAMRTAEYAAIPPILLNGGMTEVLSGASLSQYFMAQNNVFTGFDQAQYLQTGRIPDGQYRIGFQVVDAQRSEVKLSNLTFSQPGWFLLNDPPQLNLPRNNVSERVNNPQSIKLEWFPRHLGSMNSAFATSYQVELFALRVPGMNPQQVALSLPPDYTTITNQTSFMLNQHKHLLEPGVEYAWRVKAMAGDGFTLFQNNGYSEVFSFVYGQLCPTPKKTEALPTGTESAEISWETDPKQSSYIVKYRLKSEEETIWHEKESYSSSTEIANVLSPGTAYEYQVKAKCTTTESEYSPIKSFTTQQLPPTNFECGKSDTAGQVTNFTPKMQLEPGDIIYNGKFPVKITKIEGAAGSFNGEGRMRIPMLANIQINMKFTSLKVNEENQVFGGEMVSVYNEDSPFFIEDLSDYWGEGDQIGNVITGQDSAAIILTYEVTDPGDLEITIDGDNVVITSGGNTTYADVDDAGSGTTIVDSEGNIFSVDVDDNGNTTVTQVGTSGGSTTSGSDYNTNAGAYNQLDNKTTVTFYNNGKWAFDERNPEYEGSLFDSEYEKIGDYYVPWKLVPLGKADKIKARVTSGTIEDPEKLKFLTPTGTEFFAKYEDGEYLLEVIGARERDGIELYAIYMPDDTTKISVGKLKIASYPRLDMKVKLVPMGDFHIDGIISEDILNEIYNPYYIHWHITIDSEFTNTSWDEGNDGLQGTGSEFYSMFTPEMRALNTAYTEERGVDEESLYLFIFPDGNSEGNLMGDMPLKSRFGYIFNADGADTRKITQTVAHELGHGAFQLKHTFSDKYGIDQNTTQNLMDYAGGTELVKYQWDVVHDPQNKLFNWGQDEEEGQAIAGIYYDGFFFYPDGEYLGHTGGDKILVMNESVPKDLAKAYVQSKDKARIYNKVLTVVENKKTVLSVLSTIFKREIGKHLVEMKLGEGEDGPGGSCGEYGKITAYYKKNYKGEYLYDNYYNVINIFYHEDHHGVDDKNGWGWHSRTPEEQEYRHFNIAKAQRAHNSYSKTTPIFKNWCDKLTRDYIAGIGKTLAKRIYLDPNVYKNSSIKSWMNLYDNLANDENTRRNKIVVPIIDWKKHYEECLDNL